MKIEKHGGLKQGVCSWEHSPSEPVRSKYAVPAYITHLQRPKSCPFLSFLDGPSLPSQLLLRVKHRVPQSYLNAAAPFPNKPEEFEAVHSHTFRLKTFKKGKHCGVCKQTVNNEGLICRVCRLACHRKCEVKLVLPTAVPLFCTHRKFQRCEGVHVF
ncbi:hypothetical protein QQF64_032808 [Cirrhinus molitorella]|uniref:Phorbol-ester/DAG-type domain-containing protein n=1 Tax=Cirrhinus molitorella TaxID=172907 RepID=A0ABR3MS96_9TELE